MKKIFIYISIFAVFLSFNVFASTNTNVKLNKTEISKIQKLIDTNIINGRKAGNKIKYDLDQTITRAEFAKIITTILNLDIKDYKYLECKKDDVSKDHWAYSYIALITHLKNKNSGQYIMKGYPNNTFKPDSPITFAEVSTILVKLKKSNLKDELIIKSEYPKNFLKWSNRENIYRDIDENLIVNYGDYILRKDAFHLLYNTFYIPQ